MYDKCIRVVYKMKNKQNNDKIIFLSVVLKERIWGGTFLKKKYAVFSADPIGEAWVCSGHLNGQSIITHGPYQGQALNDFYLANGHLFSHHLHDRFPLLIKIIDAVEDLSVQVHPHDEYARLHHNDLGKNECWYILKAKPNASIIFGLKTQTPATFKEAVTNNRWSDVLKSLKVSEGEFYNIPTGTVHAIGAGVQILEIQQSSDTTYRLYDYNRKDSFGNERELHLDQAFEVINYETKTPEQTFLTYHRVTRLVSTPYFTVDKWAEKDMLTVNQNDTYTILFANKTDGIVWIDNEKMVVPEGHTVILTRAVTSFTLETKGEFFLIKETTVPRAKMYSV